MIGQMYALSDSVLFFFPEATFCDLSSSFASRGKCMLSSLGKPVQSLAQFLSPTLVSVQV